METLFGVIKFAFFIFVSGGVGGAIGWVLGKVLGIKELGTLIGVITGIIVGVILGVEVGRIVGETLSSSHPWWNVGGAEAVWTTGGQPQEIDVTVVDAFGNPLPDILVHADNSSGGNYETTDRDGHTLIEVGEPELTGLYVRKRFAGSLVRVINRTIPVYPKGLRVTVTVTDLEASVPYIMAGLCPLIVVVIFLGLSIILIAAGVARMR